MKETIEIEITNYNEETEDLKREFKRLGLQAFDSLDFQFKQIPEGTYHVELKHVFSNQYNTAEGFRVFEKHSSLDRDTLKPGRGYYISEGIEKIREYQKDLKTCGYCGKQYYKSDQTICNKCLGNEYLKEDELHLLKLINIRENHDERTLTEEEREAVLRKYHIAQGLGKTKRAEAKLSKNRRRVAGLIKEARQKGKELIDAAEVETEAYTWLLDHKINVLDNVIYYPSKNKFSFGWRKPLTNKEMNKLQDLLTEFPFDYGLEWF